MESIPRPAAANEGLGGGSSARDRCGFRMPLHYPRYTKAEYEDMPEWKLDCLLAQYGLPAVSGDVQQKKKFAMGAFLWENN